MPQMSSIVASDQVLSAGVYGMCRSHRMPPLIVSAGVARHWSDEEGREAGLPRLPRQVAVVDVLAGRRIQPRGPGNSRDPAGQQRVQGASLVQLIAVVADGKFVGAEHPRGRIGVRD